MMFVPDLKSQIYVEAKQCVRWLAAVEVSLHRKKFPGFATDLQPNKLSLLILSESKCHWDSVAVQHLCFCSLYFFFLSVCVRLQSKFCKLWSKSSLFLTLQHLCRVDSCLLKRLSDCFPASEERSSTITYNFFFFFPPLRPSAIQPDVDSGGVSSRCIAPPLCHPGKA